MGIKEKENKRKSVVESLVGNASKNRISEEKGLRKQKGFRLSIEVARALAIKSAKTGEDQEEIVERLLREYLKDEIENMS